MLDIPHRFYAKSKREQNRFLILPILLFFLLLVLSLSGLIFGRFWTLLFFPLIFVPAQFVDTPLGHRNKTLLYFSPLFIVQPYKENFIIHGGTIFDYAFVFDRTDLGNKAQKKVLKEFLSGLIKFIEYLEDQNLGETKISGTSYFFNNRNAKKFGFTISPTSAPQRIILLFNFIVLTATYSFTQGRLAFPPIQHTKSVEATGKELINHKMQLQKTLAWIDSA